MNQQTPYSRFNGGYKQIRPMKKPQRVHITPEQGKVAFRLLCPIVFAGAVIGTYGTVVKSLELETSARIHIEDSLTVDSTDRVVYVVGADAVDRAATLRSVGGGEIGDGFDVSSAQVALLRVYEKILQVESAALVASDSNGGGGNGSVRCCKLLALTDQIGALMGREGKRIEQIWRESGAFVRVLTPEHLPPCADPADQLIQITGDGIAVRKALVLVSKRLQENQQKEKPSAAVTTSSVSSSYGAFQYSQTQSYPNNGSSFTQFTGNAVKPPPAYSSLKDKDLHPNMDGLTNVEVIFRMLCSSDLVGSIIGKGGCVVRALQEETGAYIHIDAQVAGCLECAITISALEKVESYQSSAQNAAVRVFARATETLTKSGLVSQWNNREGVNARLLIQANQVGCLIGVRGAIVSDLAKVTGTRIQILEGEQVPQCATSDERVVQIVGEYVNVEKALVEVTRRLRERIFTCKGVNVQKTRGSAPYPVPNYGPAGRGEEGSTSISYQTSNSATYKNGTHMLEQKMEDLHLSQGGDDHHMPKFLPHQHFVGRRAVATSTGNAEAFSEESPATVTNMTVEVVVAQNIFTAVFDEGGSNLARLREISGAKVEVQHPSAGNDGKVILSGTPDQTLAGQSLLRAYIVTAK